MRLGHWEMNGLSSACLSPEWLMTAGGEETRVWGGRQTQTSWQVFLQAQNWGTDVSGGVPVSGH